jgi:hypothetical protein
MRSVVAGILLGAFCAFDVYAASETDITINITATNVSKPSDPNYLKRCAFFIAITNNSANEVASMTLQFRERIEEINHLAVHASQSIFVGFFGDCKEMIDSLTPKVNSCLWQSDVGADCRSAVKFMLRGGWAELKLTGSIYPNLERLSAPTRGR